MFLTRKRLISQFNSWARKIDRAVSEVIAERRKKRKVCTGPRLWIVTVAKLQSLLTLQPDGQQRIIGVSERVVEFLRSPTFNLTTVKL